MMLGTGTNEMGGLKQEEKVKIKIQAEIQRRFL